MTKFTPYCLIGVLFLTACATGEDTATPGSIDDGEDWAIEVQALADAMFVDVKATGEKSGRYCLAVPS
jgi:hypothetical protein